MKIVSCMTQYACDGLNENGLHRIIYLDVWFPVDGTVWEGVGGVD